MGFMEGEAALEFDLCLQDLPPFFFPVYVLIDIGLSGDASTAGTWSD
jgi:hypothetical protein